MLTNEEATGIEAVRTAVKALPKTLYIEVDSSDGVLFFWKRKKPDGDFTGMACRMAEHAAPDLRCKRALTL